MKDILPNMTTYYKVVGVISIFGIVLIIFLSGRLYEEKYGSDSYINGFNECNKIYQKKFPNLLQPDHDIIYLPVTITGKYDCDLTNDRQGYFYIDKRGKMGEFVDKLGKYQVGDTIK